MTSLYQRFKTLVEHDEAEPDDGFNTYHSSLSGHKAVISKDKGGRHIVKFYHHGKHMTDADYVGRSENDAHEFAADEMALRRHVHRLSEGKGIPLDGHAYHSKSDESLRFIMKDATEAAKAMQDHSPKAESKYLDQANDAATVLHYRKTNGITIKESEEVSERINMPQGRERTPDRITNDTEDNKGGRVKKMMGNRLPMELIARILSRKI